MKLKSTLFLFTTLCLLYGFQYMKKGDGAHLAERHKGMFCPEPPMAGLWQVTEKGHSELKEVELIHICTKPKRKYSNGIKGALWTIRAWHGCRPANCLWGREKGSYDEKTGRLKVMFETFNVTRQLVLVPVKPGVLRAEYEFYPHDGSGKTISGSHIMIKRRPRSIFFK